MSHSLWLIMILATGTMSCAAVHAQEISQIPAETSQLQPQVPPQQPPEFGDPRFAFHRTDKGFLRLDLHTGAVASCSQDAAGWACVMGREERTALDSELARLRRDNAALKNALLARGVALPSDMNADAPPGTTAAPVESVPRPPQSVPPAASVPPKAAEPDRASRDDAELERIMAVMEKVWRRLVEIMVNVQRDMQKK